MLTAAGSDERRMMNIVLVRSESVLFQRSESGPLSSKRSESGLLKRSESGPLSIRVV